MTNEEVSFQRERLTNELLEEGLPLLLAHYQEVMPYPDIGVNIDRIRYLMMEQAGYLRCFTVRSKGELIGYANFYVSIHPHSKHTVQAYCDVIYIKPQHRGIGSNFISWCDKILNDQGVKEIHYAVSTRFDWSKLLERKGYVLTAKTYTRRLTPCPSSSPSSQQSSQAEPQ